MKAKGKKEFATFYENKVCTGSEKNKTGIAVLNAFYSKNNT